MHFLLLLLSSKEIPELIGVEFLSRIMILLKICTAGATAEQIEAIPTIVVGHPGAESEKGCRCPICLEDVEPGALLRRMACKHQFHKSCLDKWLGHKSVCPICQQNLS